MRLAPIVALAILMLCTACPSGDSPDAEDGGGNGNRDGGELVGQPPQLTMPAALTLNEGEEQTVPLEATDPDGDALGYSLVQAPSFVTLGAQALTLAPGYADAGSFTVRVSVTDGTHAVEGSFEVTVVNVNRPPVLEPIADQTVEAGGVLLLPLVASDPDGDALTFQLAAGPGFASVSNGVLTLAPSAGFAGAHALTVEVTDGAQAVSTSFTVTVVEANEKPLLSALSQVDASQAQVPGGAMVALAPALRVAFTEAEGDEVTIEAEVVPTSASFTGEVTHTSSPSATSPLDVALGTLGPGAYKWQARARDSKGGTSAWEPFNSGLTAFTVGAGPLFGSVQIQGGAHAVKNTQVALTLAAESSAGQVTQMRFSNDGVTWTAWEPFATSKQNHPLADPGQDGVKTVWAELEDDAGNVIQVVDSVVLDRVAPEPPGIDYRNGRHFTNEKPVPFRLTTTEPSTVGLSVITSVVHGDTLNPNIFCSNGAPFSNVREVNDSFDTYEYLYVVLQDAAGNCSAHARYQMQSDTVPPQINQTVPENDAARVSPSQVIFRFNEVLEPETLGTAQLTSSVPGHWALSGDGRSLHFHPDAPFPAGVMVTLTVAGVEDRAWNALATPRTLTFQSDDRTSLPTTAVALRAAPLIATNAKGTMVVTPNLVSSQRAVYEWTFWNGQGWSSGTLGAGMAPASSDEPAQLVAWEDRFVAVWETVTGRRWAIFSGGAWSTPAAPAPKGQIAANALGVMSAWVDEISFLVPPYFTFSDTDYRIFAQLFDGTAWGPQMRVAENRSGVIISSVSPKVAANDGDFAVLYGAFNASSSFPTVRRYNGGKWDSAGSASTTASGAITGGVVVGTGNQFAAYLPKVTTLLTFDGTGWTPFQLNTTITEMATDGQGFAAASANGALRVFSGGSWGPQETRTGTLELLTGGEGRYVAVHKDAASATLSISVYENGSWSAPFTTPAATSALGLTATGVAIDGADLLVSYQADGNAHAAVRDGMTWTTSAPLQSGDESSGGGAALKMDGALTALWGDGRAYVASAWGVNAFGPPVTVAQSPTVPGSSEPAVSFLPSGEGLAVVLAYDHGQERPFAALFDGTSWQPATALSRLPARDARVTNNGSRFVALWRTPLQSATYTNRAGVMAASYVPGAGASAPVQLNSAEDNFENSGLGVAVASDGTGFLAVYPWAETSGGAESFVYRTSADGEVWSAPSTVETNVTASFRDPQVVGNAGGYLLLTPVSNSAWNRRIHAAGTLGSALGAPEGSIAASAVGFAFLEQSGSSPKAYLYEGGAWDAGKACTKGNTASRMLIAGNASGFRVALGNSTQAYDGTSWSAAQALGQQHINNLVGVGSEYLVVVTDDPWSAAPTVFAARAGSGTLPPLTTLGGGRDGFLDRDIAVGGTATSAWALWEVTDALTEVDAVVMKPF